MSHKKPAFANTAQPVDAAGLARACLSLSFGPAGFCIRGISLGHTACVASRVRECTRGCLPQRCLRCGAVNIEGLSAERRFVVGSSWMSRGCLPQRCLRCGSREPRGRGAVCYKAIHAADWAATGAACFCKRLGRASGFRMALNRTGLQGSGDKRRCYRQGFRKMAFPYWVM